MTRKEAISRFRKGADRQVKWTDFAFDFEMLLHSIYDNIEADTQKANAYFLENISLYEENEILIEQINEKDNEIARLRKMVAQGHHIQCACSFCNSGAGFIYGSDFKDELQ